MINAAWRTLAIGVDYWRLYRAQWRDREWLERVQAEKLRAIVDHAWRTVPFYRERFDLAGIRPDAIRSPADLASLPLTTKAQLQAADVASVTSSAYRAEQLDSGLTSGATGQPFAFFRDPHAMRLRKSLFLRALVAIGYRPGEPLVMLDHPRENQPPRWLRWHYVSPNITALDDQVRILNEMRPSFLYASRPTAVRLLARHAQATGAPLPRLRALITTGETLTDAAREQLRASFGAPVFDVYGLVETGTIAWECRAHSGLHVGEDTVILELLPSAFGEVQRIVLTSLENRGMPLIRYETGDLAIPAADQPCPCGRQLRRLARIEGRLVDCLQLPDGRLVSPSRMEHAVRRIPGLTRFQFVQDRPDAVIVRFEGRDDSEVATALQRAVSDVVGAGMQIEIRWAASLEPPPGQKFRLVQRQPAAGADPF